MLQGVFGAPLVPLSQAVMLDINPREKHGRAMAIWGVGVMVGPILGPTLGGWLTENYQLALGVLHQPAGRHPRAARPARLHAGDRAQPRRGFDFFGFALLSLARRRACSSCSIAASSSDWFSLARDHHRGGDRRARGFYLFLVQMFTAEQPFIEPGLFNDRNFVAGVC